MDNKFAKKDEISLSNLNLLINPDFKINQRGIQSGQTLISGTYNLDRWGFNSSAGLLKPTLNITPTDIELIDTNTGFDFASAPDKAYGVYAFAW